MSSPLDFFVPMPLFLGLVPSEDATLKPPDKVGSVKDIGLGMYPAGATGSFAFVFFFEAPPAGPRVI
jgi:hypothetical protein